jgi:hypothetical protein
MHPRIQDHALAASFDSVTVCADFRGPREIREIQEVIES